MSGSFQLEAVKKLFPKSQRTMLTQDYLDRLQASIGNPMLQEVFKDNFIDWSGVIKTGKYKLEDYINAVKYVSFKVLGYSNIDAWVATFPERYQRLKDEGQTQIDAYASMYNKNKIVMQIYEQTIVPTHILNAPLYQKALNVLAEMIIDPEVRGMTRVKAAEAILAHTKAPEVIKNEFTIGVEQQSTIADLRAVTEELADKLQESIKIGHKSLKEVAEGNIIDAEYEELDNEDDVEYKDNSEFDI